MPSEMTPASTPTLSFVSKLVDESYDEELRVGDLAEVEVEDEGDTQVGTVVAVEPEGARLRFEDGTETTVEEGTHAYLDDRPSLRSLWEEHLRQAPEGVAVLDGLEASLKARLVAGFDELMAGRVDYHPGSGTVVRDLVHPSLYPHIRLVPEENAGESEPSPPQEKLGFFARMKKSMLGSAPPVPKPNRTEEPKATEAVSDLWGRPYEGSKYQWLPSTFVADEAGNIVIEDEINNLPRDEHGAMYGALASLFEAFLPLFESVYGYSHALSFCDESLEGEHELPEPAAKAVPAEPAVPKSLRGRKLQVITKIVEYRFEDAESFEGVWHVEGMSHENILATGVCTLSRDENLEGGSLRFKRRYTQEDAGALFWNVSQTRPRAIEEMVNEAHIPVGCIDALSERLFVFPNCHVHKLSDMSVRGAAGVATRRVVVFWLVDPDHPIPGVSDVPRPQDAMTFEEACDERLALMEERRLHKQSHNVRAVSLCEH